MKRLMSAAGLLLGPVLVLAQASVEEACVVRSEATMPAPIVGDAVAAQFAAITDCIESEDIQCATRGLDAIDDGDLNDDERGVYWLAAGDLEYLNGEANRARREYRRVIRQRGTNRQLVVMAIERTAVQQMQSDNFDDAADALEDLECGEWKTSHLYLRARAHYGEGEFAEAAATAQLAVDVHEQMGERVPAIWQSFATASADRAERAANERVVCRNVQTAGSNIPQRVCTSESQRDAARRDTWNTWEDPNPFGIQ